MSKKPKHSIDDYYLVSMIGVGGFGKVFLAKHK